MKKATNESRIASFYNAKPTKEILGVVTDQTLYISHLNDVFLWLISEGKAPANGWYKRLAYFIKYQVDPTTWLSRAKQIVKLAPLSQTLENMNLLYGDHEGKIRWDSYRTKQGITNSFEYKQEKYGWTQEDFDEYNKSRSVTLDNMIIRHGEKAGLEKWEAYCDRQAYTNTLEYFKGKYGEVEGNIKWEEYNTAKASSSDPFAIAKRLDISFEQALVVMAERRTNSFVSETEKAFIDQLSLALSEDIKYTYKTKQFAIWNETLNSATFFDVCCSKRKKIIEYNGDYWHANPKKYKPDFVVQQRGMTAKEIWEHDQHKIEKAMARGFEVLVVWESDFFRDGINGALKFWNAPNKG